MGFTGNPIKTIHKSLFGPGTSSAVHEIQQKLQVMDQATQRMDDSTGNSEVMARVQKARTGCVQMSASEDEAEKLREKCSQSSPQKGLSRGKHKARGPYCLGAHLGHLVADQCGLLSSHTATRVSVEHGSPTPVPKPPSQRTPVHERRTTQMPCWFKQASFLLSLGRNGGGGGQKAPVHFQIRTVSSPGSEPGGTDK
ncbi:sp110 nuclear body protein-like, partial [Equus quagga]|uniref:sp110 nuclear body protein-like n=1 Tax=Equus quagga TaxID=89248 RepID=UPI001EE1762A